MKEISNSWLVALLTATVTLSVFGTVLNMGIIKDSPVIPWITGRLSYGTVTIRITNLVSLSIPAEDIDFGSGQISQATDLSTEQVNPGTFNECIESSGSYSHPYDCRGIQIENTGNSYINITLSSSADGDSFFLGDNATDEFRFAVVEGNISRASVDSCKLNGNDGLSLFPQSSSYSTGFMNWTPINKSFIYTICHNLTYSTDDRSLVIEINMTVPADEGDYSVGMQRVAYLTFVAAEIE
ncbi:MAG: hypothetical protein QS98_C0005G0077 [archaeon GW2011_AR3]|nr:MAG: hypothetical protein QS98_C0005G0077 [archaeon GW2011_AR3]MBS3109418.1 hypothetical protein [Candidatus Woesearchaeota archaeon]